MASNNNDDSSVNLGQVRTLVERDDISSILQRIDYELWKAQEPVAIELAEETFGYLAAVHDMDVDRDLTGITLYVDKELEYLADAVPDSYFAKLYDGKDHDGYRIRGDDCYVELYFDQQHGGERREVPTKYDNLQVYVPTVETYIEYSKQEGGFSLE